MRSSGKPKSERRFLSCVFPFDKDTSIFVIPQSEHLSSITTVSHFDISVFALFRGFVALALVPPGTDPKSLLMHLAGDPTISLFKMPSALIWFGLVGDVVRHVHVPRSFNVNEGAVLCWYYTPFASLPEDLVCFFGASIGLNLTI
jgi:hypothetical protein